MVDTGYQYSDEHESAVPKNTIVMLGGKSPLLCPNAPSQRFAHEVSNEELTESGSFAACEEHEASFKKQLTASCRNEDGSSGSLRVLRSAASSMNDPCHNRYVLKFTEKINIYLITEPRSGGDVDGVGPSERVHVHASKGARQPSGRLTGSSRNEDRSSGILSTRFVGASKLACAPADANQPYACNRFAWSRRGHATCCLALSKGRS